jgi:beta-lactamase class A
MIWILLGYMINTAYHREEVVEESTSVRQSGYTYINPLLECETTTVGIKHKYIPFERGLIDKIKSIESENSQISMSVYFRNLQNGPWFWVNENAEFSPASLMKLPILFMYLKAAESNPNLLSQTLMANGENALSQIYPPTDEIRVGSGYLIADLLERLIVFSDNIASNTLISALPVEIQDRVFTDLNIPLPDTIDYTLSVKEYASFFRMLYNASYLTRDYSEKALEILARTDFLGGLTGKLPRDIKVAHKFGEREYVDPSGKIINQLHDCGIIYYEPYPYLVCIMTKWEVPMPELSGKIQLLSETIYKEVSERYPPQ